VDSLGFYGAWGLSGLRPGAGSGLRGRMDSAGFHGAWGLAGLWPRAGSGLERTADLDGPNFCPTPGWATDALIDNERLRGEIWECACGDGVMSEVLAETGSPVVSSDLYDRGYGEIGHDFLTTARRHPNIITNPPFDSAEGFVAAGLQAAPDQSLGCLQQGWRLHDLARVPFLATTARATRPAPPH
jgi:hypothetical protein